MAYRFGDVRAVNGICRMRKKRRKRQDMKRRTIRRRIHRIKFIRSALANFAGLTENHCDELGETADG